MGERYLWLWTIHCCNSTRSWERVWVSRAGNGTYRCLCGDTVFVSVDQLRRWNPESRELRRRSEVVR